MHSIVSIRKSNLFQTLLFLLISLSILSGCSVRLLSSYDENTDKAVTKLQKNFETFFTSVESQVGTPECKYDKHTKFYQDSAIAISAIEVRANALDKNKLTVDQIGLLKNSLNNLMQLHKISCFTKDQVQDLRDSFNAIFTAILKLELAKKRGSE